MTWFSLPNFCPNTVLIAKSEASHIISKGACQLGAIIISGETKAHFKALKDSRYALSKLKASLASNLVNGWAILLKSLINLQ
jgi:hypothetical protein